MQKTLAAAAFAAALGIGGAQAADLNGGSMKDAPAYVPGVNWSGFYLGGHAGGAWSDNKTTSYDEEPTVTSFANSTSGVFGGAQLGYNVQRGNFVFGAEVDLGGMDLNHATAQAIDPFIVAKIAPGFYADVTGRLGLAVDRMLIYGKGGYAYYGGSLSVTDIGEATPKVTGLDGWTVGGGLEYSINPAWSAKVEYQYFDFGKERLVMSTDGDRYDREFTVNTVKVGLNYHVWSGYLPLK
jgi:outer membrane immunogenic protein